MTKPKIIGLTGSIGMGKSTVAAMFAEAGIPVFDADAEVRAMQGADGELLPAIEAAFPGSTGPEGVDRDWLGHQVFADKQALTRLEAIVHPAVAAKRSAFLTTHADKPVLVFDIPLLFERGGLDAVDVIVVVSAPHHEQRARVLARPRMSEQKFDHILTLQTPDAEKRERAHHVIDTGTSLEDTRAQVARLIAELLAA
jgi:dephospho-CoA kinase